MTRILLSLLLALGVAIGAAAQTAKPSNTGVSTAPANPYSATVPVAGTSDAQRDAAIGNALTQVLRQVSPGFAASPDVLSNASGYVRDFHYRRAASGGGLELQVDFDPGAVTRLIAANQAGPAAAGTAGPATGAAVASAAQGGSGTLWVDGIDNSQAFAGLLATLRGDDELHNVTPVGAQGDGVLLRMDFDKPLPIVLSALTGPGGHLTAKNAPPHPGAEASLQWVP